jgi:hypothetical protein
MGRTYRHTDSWEPFVINALETASDTMINIPSFIKIDSGIQKLIGRIHRHTESMVIA